MRFSLRFLFCALENLALCWLGLGVAACVSIVGDAFAPRSPDAAPWR